MVAVLLIFLVSCLLPSLAFQRVVPSTMKTMKWTDCSRIHVPLSMSTIDGDSTYSDIVGRDDIYVSDAGLGDLIDLIKMANGQFGHTCRSLQDLVKLNMEILKLFVPKLIFPQFMSHSVIGMRSTNSNRLVGFVDLSLQPSSGTMDALVPLPFAKRKQKYGLSLEPYLCNLLVVPELRKKGLGRKLVAACEDRALSWGCQTINLHVERESIPAFSLYLSSGFSPVQKQGNVVFMKKKLRLPTDTTMNNIINMM